MARRIRPLDPADGAVQRFACELRALRAAAGHGPWGKMARHSGVSRSALAAAVAGYRLPCEPVTRAFVRACDGDWPWWSERPAQAHAQLGAAPDRPGQQPTTSAASGSGLGNWVPPARAMARGGRRAASTETVSDGPGS